MEATERFLALLAGPEPELPLDEATALIAAHADPSLDVDATLTRLDDLATHAHDDRTAEALARRLFVDWGFAGNRADYSDPRNSLLDQVLDRRLGIPITLAIVMIEIGRRTGVGLHGVGMPGHFLVGIDAEPDRWVDPFAGGAVLDVDGCRQRFASVHGPDARFDPTMVAPTPRRGIVLRVLNNLESSYARRRSRAVLWVVRLRLAFPELTAGEVRRAATVLGSFGAFTEAAEVLDRLAHDADEASAGEAGAGAVGEIEAEARALRARTN